jgi:hypothetical protein
MAELEPSKLVTRVRFPSPAPPTPQIAGLPPSGPLPYRRRRARVGELVEVRAAGMALLSRPLGPGALHRAGVARQVARLDGHAEDASRNAGSRTGAAGMGTGALPIRFNVATAGFSRLAWAAV